MVDGNATQLKILHKLAGQHHVELTIVLDFIHVCEYVWKASLGFYEETEPARQVWVQERLLRILRGEACLVAAGIRRSATRKADARQSGECGSCAYLLNHASYLHYDECLAAGFPIATGVIAPAATWSGPHGPHRSALVPRWRRSRAAASRSPLQRRLR